MLMQIAPTSAERLYAAQHGAGIQKYLIIPNQEGPHTMSLHPNTEHLLSLFSYVHLPSSLQVVSRKFHDLAHDLVASYGEGPEASAMLRKLVEAKDCAVRQAVISSTAETRTDGRR
ncbi:hypothetical protein [Gordonia sp. (in: high G+C Gram-positive bacteria)]|uniref:hypothetical protein n=1 Tax=Gordonia sp. (in: high G+C Gram-positive bacteria) TaxID=84139 RepID=UPI003C725128